MNLYTMPICGSLCSSIDCLPSSGTFPFAVSLINNQMLYEAVDVILSSYIFANFS